MRYPEILLPRQTYPALENKDIMDNALVRETMINVYPFLEKAGYEPDDILPFVVAPQPSLREIFDSPCNSASSVVYFFSSLTP